jgi:autotransporter translocation and assembly factor TamB
MRVFRRVLKVLGIAAAVLLAAVALLLMAIRTAPFRDWLRGYVVEQAGTYLNGELTVGGLTGDLLSGVALHDVELRQDGRAVIAARTIELEYDAREVVSEGLVANALRIVEPRVLLIRDAGGGWNLADLPREQQAEAGREGPARPVTIRQLVISDGTVVIEDRMPEPAVPLPRRIESIDAAASFSYEPVDVALGIERLDFRALDPDLVLQSLTGQVALHEDDLEVAGMAIRTAHSRLRGDAIVKGLSADAPAIDLTLQSDCITPREFAGYVPALAGMPIEPSVELRAEGTADDLRIRLSTASDAGSVEADVRADLEPLDRPSAEGRVQVRGLDAAQATGDGSLQSDVTGRLRFSLTGRSLDDLSGRATVALEPSTAIGYEAEALQLELVLDDGTAEIDGRLRAYGGFVSAAGTVALPRGSERDVAFDLSGRVQDVDLARLPLAADVPDVSTDLNGEWRAAGRGTGLLASLRFDPSRAAGAAVSGGTEVMVDLRGAVPAYAFRGSVQGLDPERIARLAGQEPAAAQRLAGEVNAAFDLAGRGVTIDTVDARADIEVSNSEIGEVAIRRLDVQAVARDRLARVDVLRIDSPVLRAEASGVVSLRGDEPSALDYTIEMPELGTLAALAGVQDAGGTARVTGRLTGTRDRPATAASLSASNLEYGGTRVMSLSAEVQAILPEFDLEQGTVDGEVVATLVQAAGRDIREVTLDAEYARRELGFDAVIVEAQRTLSAQGLARFLPEGQELRLDALALETEGTRWTTPSGTPATIRYSDDRIAIDGFALVNGGQRLTADGTVLFDGPGAGDTPAGRLAVTADAVALESLDDLTVGDRGLAGRLDARALLTGRLTDPTVEGTMTVTDGAFRDFEYERLTADIDYDARGAAFDLRLDQSPGARVVAQGTAPPSLFPADAAPPPGAYPLDVRARSNPIDLGIVQGFTPVITDATGTLALDLRVTGTPGAPRFDGELRVADGGFALAATGTRYAALDAAVRFDGTSARVERFRVVDGDEDPLTIDGTVALDRGLDGALDLQIDAASFAVVDNELGELEVDLDLLASGTVTSPDVSGEIAVRDGTIEVDRVLALFQTGLYATEAVEEQVEQAVEPEDGGVALDVRVRIADNLVLRGDDIRIGGRGVGLGDMNVTLGGDLTVTQTAGGEPGVFGEVQTVRGYYEFQGRRFDVERGGAIGFEGPDPSNPTLDLTAHRDIAGVRATVGIQGTAEQPRLVLSSTPPLEDADILSLIIFNRPVNDLGQGERASLSLQAQQLVGGAIASPLAESLRDVLDVDLLEIQAVAQGTSGPGVTVGQQIGERVFLQFRQLFGSAQQTEVVLEYELLDFLRLQTSFTEGTSDPQAAGGRPERAGVDLIVTVEPEK